MLESHLATDGRSTGGGSGGGGLSGGGSGWGPSGGGSGGGLSGGGSSTLPAMTVGPFLESLCGMRGGSRQASIGVDGSLLQSGSVVLLQKNTVSRPACRPASQPATCALHQASLPASRLLALYLNPHPQFRTAVCCFTISVAQGQISGNLQGVCDLTVYNFRQTPFKEVRNRMRSREAKRESAHPAHGLKK